VPGRVHLDGPGFLHFIGMMDQVPIRDGRGEPHCGPRRHQIYRDKCGSINFAPSIGAIEVSTPALTDEVTKSTTGTVEINITSVGIEGTGGLHAGSPGPECTKLGQPLAANPVRDGNHKHRQLRLPAHRRDTGQIHDLYHDSTLSI
jgi:hypothetical protein